LIGEVAYYLLYLRNNDRLDLQESKSCVDNGIAFS